MRAFIKNCLRIAIISIGMGLLLTFFAFNMDRNFFTYLEDFHININQGNEQEENLFTSDESDKITTSVSTISDNEYQNVTESYQNVTSIILDISHGEVKIEEGEEFSIEATNVLSDFKSTVKDGVWIIRDNEEHKLSIDIFNNDGDFNLSRYYEDDGSYVGNMNLFGHDYNFGSDNNSITPKIKITIPKKFTAENIELLLGAGSMNIEDNLNSNYAYINIGTGNCFIRKLSVKIKSYITVGTGDITIDKINVRNLTVDSGVGSLRATGIITGDNTITCGIGDVDINVVGNVDDYNYSVDCGIGTVIINDNRYSVVSSKTLTNEKATNNFSLECGIGNITLKIKE